MSDEQPPIIVKKVIKKGGGHHGGAWKVAYADFVTAMMAFFLLLWLLNTVTDEAKNLISSYFDPSHPQVSRRESGSGGVLGGLTVSNEGAMTDELQALDSNAATGKKQKGETQKKSGTLTFEKAKTIDLKAELKKREDARFKATEEAIQKALEESPNFQELKDQLIIEITPEGLKIEVVDKDGKPLFSSGSAVMVPVMRDLITKLSSIIETVPNDISIRGHTDSVPFKGRDNYSNWELSADRANSTRRVLMDTTIPEARFVNVIGKAAREPFIKEDDTDPQNRRITILLLRETVEEALKRGDLSDLARYNDQGEIEYLDPETAPMEVIEPDKGFERTKGEFYFP